MSHCFSVGIDIDGTQVQLCTLVKGNEDLARRVRQAEEGGAPAPKPTAEEIQRALEHHLRGHGAADHPHEADPQDFASQMGRGRARPF